MMHRRLAILVTGLVLLAVSSTQADIFTIDASQSNLTATQSQVFGLFPGTPKPGGDSTSLSGTLVANVTASSLQFLSGSSIIADDEGSFLPGIPDMKGMANNTTPAPASFAFDYPTEPLLDIDLEVALRGFELSLEDAAARTLSGGVLGVSATEMAVIAGEGHLNAGMPAISDLTVQDVIGIS